MITHGGGWTATTASARGGSHVRSGKPNQDAVRVEELGEAPGGLVAVVADGHGGARYVRSDVGARIAVEVATAAGSEALRLLDGERDPTVVERQLATVTIPTLVRRWRERVADDAARRGLDEHERAVVEPDPVLDPYVSYGCTLVMAVLGPAWIGLAQIGDGDVVVVDGAEVTAPVPGDERLIGGETTSLCLPSAATDARISVITPPLPELVIVATDGYANSFADPSWRTDVGVDLRRHAVRLGVEGIDQRLPEWLAESARVGGDDVSMAVVVRADIEAEDAPGDDERDTSASSVAPAAASSVGQAPVRGPLVRFVAPIVALVSIAAIVAVVLWSFLDGDPPDPGVEVEVPSSSLVAGDQPEVVPQATAAVEVGGEAP